MAPGGFTNVKAALPLNDDYAAHCVRAFDDPGTKVDFPRLLREARPVDFATADKTQHVVMRVSCVFTDARSEQVALFWRGGEGHTQNPGMYSLLVSSGLMDTYACVRETNGLLVNPHYAFTEKLGGYLGAFEVNPRWRFACLRRQPDRRTGGMRYYAFYVYQARLLHDVSLPTRFRLFGKASADEFRGFWDHEAALRKLPLDTLEVDALVANRLLGLPFASPDLVVDSPPRPRPPHGQGLSPGTPARPLADWM